MAKARSEIKPGQGNTPPQEPGDNGSNEQAPAKAKKTMSKEDAQAIVDKYSGINGALVPDEVKQARKVLAEV